MKWNLGLVAGAVLLTGCDMRTDPVVHGEMRLHIRERCNQGLFEIPEVVGYYRMEYCECMVDRLTDGKSRSQILEMEQNPALYMEPNEDVVRQCTEVAQPESATPGAASDNSGS